MEKIKLTQFAKGAGCGCKIAPAVLDDILSKSRNEININSSILVGNNTNDDASVIDLKNGNALLLTADFFMPIVDDPYTFGQVAAANSISDVYAMGGQPINAIALLGWPIDKIPAVYASEVMAGAKNICEQAGIIISGGHTIDAQEPFFGLAVNGIVETKNIKRNSTAKKGDVLMMSKKIGVGILATAEKRGLLTADDSEAMVQQLITLNSLGSSLGFEEGVHAMTDITGFGLLGHLMEMCESASLSAEVKYASIPKMHECKKYIDQHVLPDATYRNWNAYSAKINIDPSVDPKESFMLLPDPQTNGGLLIAVDPESVERMLEIAEKHGTDLHIIGRFNEADEKIIYFK